MVNRFLQFQDELDALLKGILDSLKWPVVFALGIASGYTTYLGMREFVLAPVAAVITAAVQTTIISGSYDLANVAPKAHPVRWLVRLAILLLALSVSISFTYQAFYIHFHRQQSATESFPRLSGAASDYRDRVFAARQLVMAQRRQAFDALQKRRETEAMRDPRSPAARELERQVRRERAGFKALDLQFQGVERSFRRYYGVDWTPAVLDSPAAYERATNELESVANDVDHVFTHLGQASARHPVFPSWKELQQPTASLTRPDIFALLLAIAFDALTVLFSLRLHGSSGAHLSDEEVALLYRLLCEYRSVRLNENDQVELDVSPPVSRLSEETPVGRRILAASTVLNNECARRVDASHIEFTPRLSNRLIKLAQRSESALRSTDPLWPSSNREHTAAPEKAHAAARNR